MIKPAHEAKKLSSMNLEMYKKVDDNLAVIARSIDVAISKGKTYIELREDKYNEPDWFVKEDLKSLLSSTDVTYLTLLELKRLGYVCQRVIGTATESSAFGDCDVQTSEITVSWG